MSSNKDMGADSRLSQAEPGSLGPAGFDPARLPSSLEGHWDTLDGCHIAQEYATKTRAELCHGDKSDLVIANAVFMANREDLDLIHWQTAAKERIRWLSAQLAIATETRRAETTGSVEDEGAAIAQDGDA